TCPIVLGRGARLPGVLSTPVGSSAACATLARGGTYEERRMSKKRRGGKHHRGGGRVTPKGTGASRPRHFAGPAARPVDEHPLAHVGALLRSDHPLDLLAMGSSMAWVMDPKQVELGPEPERTDRNALLESLLGS